MIKRLAKQYRDARINELKKDRELYIVGQDGTDHFPTPFRILEFCNELPEKSLIATFGEATSGWKGKLLTIELDDIKSVPVVKYQGQEIKFKSKVLFNWHMDGLTTVDIRHHNDRTIDESVIGHNLSELDK